MRLRHRLAITASLVASSVLAPTVIGALPQAHAMSINCVSRANGGYLCHVIHDDGTDEYFEVAAR